MDNVKFFDKNGVELNVGDVVILDSGVKDIIIRFGMENERPYAITKVWRPWLEICTKHTPKLVKIKRTFEEVCELVKQDCLFKTSGSCLSIYNPVIDVNDNSIRVAYTTVSAWLFKPKNSDTWQELEYKKVEE